MMLFVGQEILNFTVYRSESVQTTGGRVLQNVSVEVGHFRGVLGSASSSEKERRKQLAHPVDHKVIVKGKCPDLQVGDFLQVGGKKLILSAIPYDVGGLGHYVILYCSERRDL